MNSERVAVITGAGSGIGEATAKCFAAAGYRVAVLDIDVAKGQAVAASLGAPHVFMAVDVADATSVSSVAAALSAQFGRIDVLVNSGGILQNATRVLDMDLGEAERILRINYLGTVACCQAFGRLMKAAGQGSIVTLASVNSYRPSAQPAYGATKTAIVSLTETLAAELGPSGVRVNAVAPGYTLTPAMQARIDSGQRDPQAIIGATALGCFVQPADVAEAILFLCSDKASVITGITLPIDAGWLAMTAYKSWAAQPN
ncbi:MAG: SDR family oxidoreductase [Rhodospirillaceae bacterium]|nr:SDR family oxidoreductase [Rhodospirillaceae bacterium]